MGKIISGNVGICAAAHLFKVPYAAIQNRIAKVCLKHALGILENSNPAKLGHRTVLGDNVENELCKIFWSDVSTRVKSSLYVCGGEGDQCSLR
jgi:hypothetical protein